jgi:hypothetical protein
VARNTGNNTRLVSPTMPGSVLTIVGQSAGTAELIDETWPDLAPGTVGALAAGVPSSSDTACARKITWTPGTFLGWNVRLRDSQATPVVYSNGPIAAPAGVLLTWALYNRGPNTQVGYGPFVLTARKRGFKEIVKTFAAVQPVTESFLPEVDAYYTNDQSALAGISADAAAKTLTLSASFVGALDQINDWLDWWLEQPPQLASVPATPKANSGANMTISDWTIVNEGVINAGAKIKTFAVQLLTNTGTVNAGYTDSTKAGSISGVGASAGDTIEQRKLSDGSLIASRTGPGAFAVAPANVGVAVYFVRLVGADIVMSTKPTPVTLIAGVNPDVPLFAGAQVQVAGVDGLAKVTDLAPLALEASVQSRASQASVTALGTPAQAASLTAEFAEVKAAQNALAADVATRASQASVNAIPAPLDATQTQAAAAAALAAYDAVVPADLAGLALEASVQTAIAVSV